MDKFKDRYVLAEGYPWAMGTEPYTGIVMLEGPRSIPIHNKIDFPVELWSADLPKYRLVLEKVNET